MNSNLRLSYAIAAILSGSGAYSGLAHAAPAADTGDSEGIQEIIVTAQRRTESIQNVPITIQAITGTQLQELNVSTIEEALKYLPNVTFGTNGPGSGNIFMRGLSAGFAGNQSSATIAPFPNVATYLDDQSVTFPARNLDVYYADMERIEVLEGPQGTLFGGGAEAGVVRYITNKPKLNVTEGSVEASYGITAGGDPNSSGVAVLNLPLIQDTLAVRAVIYNDRRGGYINNEPSTFTRMNTDPGDHYFKAVGGVCPNGLPPGSNGGCVPANSQSANNYALAQPDSNPVTYTGIRASMLYQMNDDWNVLIAQSYQNMEADGEFTQFPTGSEGQPLGAWQDNSFTPAVDKDKFENTAWTVNGKIGDLKAVYTGAYLVRNLYQTNDYTNYARSNGGYYYSCTGGGANGTGFDSQPPLPSTPVTCYSPVTSWQDTVRNTHLTEEFRLSTPDDWRTRGIFGAYWEEFKIQDDMNFLYKTFPSCTPANLSAALVPGGAPCVANVITAPGSTAMNPGERNDNTAFGEDAQRGYHQTAVFASADFDILPKVLTVTGGTRWYRYTNYEEGSEYVTATNLVNVPNGSVFNGHNINAESLNSTYTGFRSRGNLTWHVTPDAMVYYTFSQGFRPGGFNRSQGLEAPISNGGVAQYEKPQGYAPDELINNEVGWKTEWLDHRLQFNGSLYYMKWTNVQMEFYNPPVLGNTTFAVNGPNFTIKGFELQVVARITDGLTVFGSSSYNDARQTNSPCLTVSNPALMGTPGYGGCITESYQKGIGVEPLVNPFGAVGTRPAFSPINQFNLRARYDLAIHDYKTWVMVGANHVGDMSNNPATYTAGSTQPIPQTTFLRYDQPGYTTYDAAIGVGKDNWTVQINGTNLGNSDASLFTSSAQFIKAEVPLRPRVLSLTVGYKF